MSDIQLWNKLGTERLIHMQILRSVFYPKRGHVETSLSVVECYSYIETLELLEQNCWTDIVNNTNQFETTYKLFTF